MIFQSLSTPDRSGPCLAHPMRLIALGLVTTCLSACSWIGAAATEGTLALTERHGLQSFALEGDLPAQFGLAVTAWYSPVHPSGLNCQTTDLNSDKPRIRSLGKGFDIPVSTTANTSRRSIPLSYYVGACAMRLTQVEMKIRGRYGQQPWQKTYADAVFYVRRHLPEGEAGFAPDATLTVDSQCTWLFQESKLNLELSKLLTCKGAGANLQYDQLAGKTVRLAISVNPEEEPSHEETWIKFPSGWKPCAHESSGWRWCRNPPTFKTFKMNGQTCTVYPGCTE